MPRQRQSAAKTLAQKAVAAGFNGEQVDGNDVVAVHAAVAAALERARGGGGPHLVEAMTYRLCDHTTADDPSRYRDDAEVSRHWPEEPVLRLRHYLTEPGHWTKADEERLLQETAAEITAPADAYLAIPPQEPSTIFDYTFASLPAELAVQRQAALGRAGIAAPEAKISNRTD
jgi:2-oxoisovalerate dehydrogenase E1 component alpha subunit